MNILYVVHDNKRGGAAISFLEMLSFIGQEHNVYVLTPHKDGFLPEKLNAMRIPHSNAHYFWWKIAVPVNEIGAKLRMFIYKILNIWNYVEAYRIKKIIREKEIDIIHSNSSVINFGALLSKMTGVPHIWHLREYGEEDFNFRRVVSEKRYRNEMNSYAAGYIAISKSIKNKFSFIVDENKVFQIYNGVSEEYSCKKTFESEEKEDVKFLISGNYCKEKGQADVIKAVIELRKQEIEGFKLYLAGGGDFAEPRKLVEEYDLQKYVVFCGSVDNMLQLRKEVDVEIVASKYEAFGRVTVEAMRMSNPVIGTNAGGTPELITDGYNGFLFQFGDYEQLAQYMKKYICDKALVRKMGMNAYRAAEGNFTPAQNANKVLEVYSKILHV